MAEYAITAATLLRRRLSWADAEIKKGNYAAFRAVHRNPKPVIVAVHGFVLGGGIGLSGAADIVLASDCARFGVPEIDRGAMGGRLLTGTTFSRRCAGG